MWQSINNEIPFALSSIISGKLFEVECSNCGLKTYVDYPILVNDMEHHAMVYYTFPDESKETETAIVGLKKMYDGHARIVTDQASLREKVAIFNAELDDRVIELLKVIVVMQVQDELDGKSAQAVYFIADDDPRLEIVWDGKSGFITVDMELYDRIKDELFDEELLAQDEDLYVDQDWANSFIDSIVEYGDD